MRTIQIEVEDSLYDEIVRSGIDLKERLQEFVYDLTDDGYPAISTEEARRRVREAVEAYRNNPESFRVMDDGFWHDTERRLKERNRMA